MSCNGERLLFRKSTTTGKVSSEPYHHFIEACFIIQRSENHADLLTVSLVIIKNHRANNRNRNKTLHNWLKSNLLHLLYSMSGGYKRIPEHIT